MFNEIDINDKIPLELTDKSAINSISQDKIPIDSEVNSISNKKNLQNLCYKTIKKVQKFLTTNALPLVLLLSVIIGVFVPHVGTAIDHKAKNDFCFVIMFFYSGLYLSNSSIIEAFKAYRAAIWGMLSILCVTCVIGAQLTSLMLFNNHSNLLTNSSLLVHINRTSHNSLLQNKTIIHYIDSFKAGLVVYFSTPCTVSSGVLMVTQIDGNTALAVLLTVVTNIAGIFTTPLFIKWILTTGSQIKLDVSSLLPNLSLCLLLPILVGKSLRYVKFVKTFISDPNRMLFLMLCSITALAVIVLIQVSKASSGGGLRKLTFISTIHIIGWTLIVHFILLLINGIMSWVLRLERKQLKCIVILSSQKSVTIASAVLIFIPIEFGDRGLMAIAVVVAHLSITLFDAFLIPLWLYIEKKNAGCCFPNTS